MRTCSAASRETRLVVFARRGALWIVPPNGGAARTLTTLDAARHVVLHEHPIVSPGERYMVFASLTTESGAERIEAVPLAGGSRTVVVERPTSPAWSPTGHLLFARDDAVMAAAFDARTATVSGAAVSVIPSGTLEALPSGGLGFEVSSTGTLLYLAIGFTDTRMVSVGRDGAAVALGLLPSDQYANLRISPDGRRLLVSIGGNTIESVDPARGTRARLTAAAVGTSFPMWCGDGSRIVLRRFDSPFRAAADGGRQGRSLSSATGLRRPAIFF